MSIAERSFTVLRALLSPMVSSSTSSPNVRGPWNRHQKPSSKHSAPPAWDTLIHMHRKEKSANLELAFERAVRETTGGSRSRRCGRRSRSSSSRRTGTSKGTSVTRTHSLHTATCHSHRQSRSPVPKQPGYVANHTYKNVNAYERKGSARVCAFSGISEPYKYIHIYVRICLYIYFCFICLYETCRLASHDSRVAWCGER